MEEIIGVWIDNKFLYSKVFVTTLTAGANGSAYVFTDIDITDLNIKKVIDIKGKTITTNKDIYNVNTYNKLEKFSIGSYVRNLDNKKVLTIRHNQSTVDGATAYVKLLYTKTTD